MLPLPKYEFLLNECISTIEFVIRENRIVQPIKKKKKRKVIYSKVLLVYSIIIERRKMD